MAAKSLTEAIHNAIMAGPMSEFEVRATGQLRDYFSHEVMRYEAALLRQITDGPALNDLAKEKAMETKDLLVAGAKNLFDRAFKDIPGFKKGDQS